MGLRTRTAITISTLSSPFLEGEVHATHHIREPRIRAKVVYRRR